MQKLYVLDSDPIARLALKRSLPQWELCFFDNEVQLKQALCAQFYLNSEALPAGVLCEMEQEQENSHQLARWIQKKGMPVSLFYATGRTRWRDVAESLRQGARDILFKPFLPQQMRVLSQQL